MLYLFAFVKALLTVVMLHSLFAWGVVPGGITLDWAQALVLGAVLHVWLLDGLDDYFDLKFAERQVTKGRSSREEALLAAVVGACFLRVMTILVMWILFRV